jgi:hypothetical protein
LRAGDQPTGGKTDKHDHEGCEDVDDVVIRRQHDCQSHGQGTQHRERPHPGVPRRAPDSDAGDEVPPEVQAGKRRVLVGEPRRLQCAVGLRVKRDGVRQHRVCKARRRDGEEGEEDEADRTGDQHCVAQEQIAVAAIAIEDDSDRDDHGPVAPDVNPVRDRGERVACDDRLL